MFTNQLAPKHIAFIERQKIFFVATSPPEGAINLSPKGLDTLRVRSPHQVSWINLTGSGNETAAHLLADSRMTLMFCSFDAEPLILRLYGTAKAIHPRDEEWDRVIGECPRLPGARQAFVLDIERVQTSCGFSVPRYEFVAERDTLTRWAEKKGDDGLKRYWEEHNQVSIDGAPTGIFSKN